MNAKIILAILVLALVSLACGFTIDLPARPTAGPEIEESITVPNPSLDTSGGSEASHLTLSFGAGKLTLSPGAQDLVDGTATYNVKDLKPQIETDGDSIELTQGDFKRLPPVEDIRNEWDLKLGDAPMDLTIKAGAYEGNFELGGLALQNLTVKDGASNVKLSFAEPNLTEMALLRYETGASHVELTGLANANFSTLAFSGGAGNYSLDFGGKLQRDAVVTIEAGLGDLSLLIPEDMNATVTVEGAALNVNHSSGWVQNGQKYTQKGSGSTLTIVVKMSAGNLVIAD
jgi:hypothetical protein